MANSESARATSDAARALLDGLDEEQRTKATADFGGDGDDDARTDWHYIPRRRAGLSFRRMDAEQEQLAYRVVATGLSLPAFAAVTTIIGLEDVLDQLEGGGRQRHRADYSVIVFGEPGAPRWGWRFEGHHVSLNVTVVYGAIIATPLFLGSNPAEVVASTGAVVARPLAGEEDLALALFATLDAAQRDETLLGPEAPDDILTTNAPTLDELPDARGVRFAELRGSGPAAAESLVRHYLDRLPPAEADDWWHRLRPDLGDVRFAFAGQPEHRRPQYYRLAGPHLFVEYDNTQNDANHVHSVLRDPARDFGIDLLRTHRRDHHENGD
jgi:hypothetical protein